MYIADGTEYVRKVGSRQSVWDDVCYMTAGGLKKGDLEQRGSKIISKKRSALGKARFAQRNPFQKQEKKVEIETKKKVMFAPSDDDTPGPAPSAKRKRRRPRHKKKGKVAAV